MVGFLLFKSLLFLYVAQKQFNSIHYGISQLRYLF